MSSFLLASECEGFHQIGLSGGEITAPPSHLSAHPMYLSFAPAFISHLDPIKLLGQKHLGLTRTEHGSHQRDPTRHHGFSAEGAVGSHTFPEKCRGFRLLSVPRCRRGSK